MSTDGIGTSPPPSRAISLAISAGLVAVWAFVRLVVFDATLFPLTYALPLLVCVWTRDRIALWGMAAIFAILHVTKLVWILPPGALTPDEFWSSLVATFANIAIGAIVVDAIVRLRGRLQAALDDVRAQAEELRAQREQLAQQNEELAEQSEELARQTEELSEQGEELASQNEELQSQAEEIGGLNAALERRGRLLETLLEIARLSGEERTALQHISAAAVDLFGDAGGVVSVYEQTPGGLVLRALAGAAASAALEPETRVADGLAAVAIEQGRTAALNDLSLRPDLAVPRFADHGEARASLCTPIRFGTATFGVFAIYSPHEHDWTAEEFRLAEWCAAQCGRVLQMLRVQSDLRQADQRKSEFLATLSHELRNPLAPIRFALSLIEREQRYDAKAVGIMKRQFHQLVRLVEDLLDATRLSKNKIQVRKSRTDFVAVVQQAVEASRPDVEGASHSLTMALPTAPVWIHADPERMAQVVTNLLNNATRYTPPGGRISVTVTATEGETVLAIADTGVGLDADDLQRVFDMFTQVGGPGSGGLGIGLALVRGIVELHGGRVEARSGGANQGSEFRLTLPLAPAVSPENPAEAAAPQPVAARRVLVVDDNTDAAAMTAALLEMHGHRVWVAHDAHAALAVARDASPDVALLDIGLPGLDGYELARRLRGDSKTERIRLIAVTGWGQDGDRARAREAGFDAHLTKPAEPEIILSIL